VLSQHTGCTRASILRSAVLGASLVTAMVPVAGCTGSDNPQGRQSISGEVTLGGKPLDHGSIRFEPQDASIGTSDAAMITQGAYKISVDQGLAPGAYRVFITATAANDDERTADEIMNDPKPAGKEMIPAKYNRKSELTAQVSAEDPNQFDFALETR